MKIDKIVLGENGIFLKHPFVTALRRVEKLESIVVRVETESGWVGYGETAPTEAITGESKESIFSALRELRAHLLGRDLNEFEAVIETIQTTGVDHSNARAAMEIALYDVVAQAAGVPLVTYLGGSIRSLETGITISLGSREEMVAQSLQALEEGYRSLKIKLGSDPVEDMERITAIYDAVGERAHLKLDANQGWSAEETIVFLSAIEERKIPIELIEQPLPREDLEGLAAVRRHTSVPILVDESVFTLEDARAVLAKGAADCINIKLDKCGGISQALQIADLCAEAHVSCMMGCMLEGAVSVGAAAHVAAARPKVIILIDLDAPVLCADQPVRGGVMFTGPAIAIPEESGLGIEEIVGVKWEISEE